MIIWLIDFTCLFVSCLIKGEKKVCMNGGTVILYNVYTVMVMWFKWQIYIGCLQLNPELLAFSACCCTWHGNFTNHSPTSVVSCLHELKHILLFHHLHHELFHICKSIDTCVWHHCFVRNNSLYSMLALINGTYYQRGLRVWYVDDQSICNWFWVSNLAL